MRWLLSNDTAMTWLLCGSVFFMFFALGVFAGVVAFPPAICAALVRTAIFYRKRKAAEAGPRRSAVKRS
jgi:hypothetical protein